MEAERIAEHDHRPSNKPDDGEWFRMSYRVIEALYSLDGLNKNHLRLILYIIRMTWGWNRRTFIFDTKEAIKATGIPASRMTYLFKPLLACDILKSERGEYGVNKYVHEWDLERLSTMTEGNLRKTEKEPVTKSVNNSEKRKRNLRKSEIEITKNGNSEDPKPADDADLDDSKDNIKDKKDIIPLNPPSGGRKGVSEIDPRFLEAWKEYPKRTGTNSVTEAWSAFKARLEEGVSAEAMLEAIPKYRKWCEAKERIGTEYVLQGASFFGPKKRGWEGDWTIPGQAPQAAKPGEVRYAQLQRRAR